MCRTRPDTLIRGPPGDTTEQETISTSTRPTHWPGLSNRGSLVSRHKFLGCHVHPVVASAGRLQQGVDRFIDRWLTSNGDSEPVRAPRDKGGEVFRQGFECTILTVLRTVPS